MSGASAVPFNNYFWQQIGNFDICTIILQQIIHRTNHEKYSGGLERTAETLRLPGKVIAETAWRQEKSCRLFAFIGACRGTFGKVRVSGNEQYKSPCEAVSWKKLHRIFVRLEKMPAILFSSPITSVRYKNKTLLIINHLQKEPWFLHLSEKVRKETAFRKNPVKNGMISDFECVFFNNDRNVVKPFEPTSFTK